MYAVHPTKMVGNQVCIKENIGPYEISISFDDSLGMMKNCNRGDIRVYLNDEDVTNKFMYLFGCNVISATISNLCLLHNAIVLDLSNRVQV